MSTPQIPNHSPTPSRELQPAPPIQKPAASMAQPSATLSPSTSPVPTPPRKRPTGLPSPKTVTTSQHESTQPTPDQSSERPARRLRVIPSSQTTVALVDGAELIPDHTSTPSRHRELRLVPHEPPNDGHFVSGAAARPDGGGRPRRFVIAPSEPVELPDDPTAPDPPIPTAPDEPPTDHASTSTPPTEPTPPATPGQLALPLLVVATGRKPTARPKHRATRSVA